jgi:hypothetical protein
MVRIPGFHPGDPFESRRGKFAIGGVAQMVERSLSMREVRGSITAPMPTAPMTSNFWLRILPISTFVRILANKFTIQADGRRDTQRRLGGALTKGNPCKATGTTPKVKGAGASGNVATRGERPRYRRATPRKKYRAIHACSFHQRRAFIIRSTNLTCTCSRLLSSAAWPVLVHTYAPRNVP